MKLRILPTIRDSRDRESHTLLFVSFAAIGLNIKFFFAGVSLPVLGELPTMSATEYGTAFGVIMAVWLGREWIKK